MPIIISQFDRIVRPADVADVGLMVDLLWSDPSLKTEWYAPSHRGASSVSTVLPSYRIPPIDPDLWRSSDLHLLPASRC